MSSREGSRNIWAGRWRPAGGLGLAALALLVLAGTARPSWGQADPGAPPQPAVSLPPKDILNPDTAPVRAAQGAAKRGGRRRRKPTGRRSGWRRRRRRLTGRRGGGFLAGGDGCPNHRVGWWRARIVNEPCPPGGWRPGRAAGDQARMLSSKQSLVLFDGPAARPGRFADR